MRYVLLAGCLSIFSTLKEKMTFDGGDENTLLVTHVLE